MASTVLSDKEARLLSAVQFHAELSIPAITKRTGLQAHTIHYLLKRLKSRGIIRPWAFINLYALGFEEYEIFFSLVAESKHKREKLLQFLNSHERVLWVAELGGDFQYAITVYAEDATSVSRFLESIVEKFGNIFHKQMMAVVVSLCFFKKKYLYPALPSAGEQAIVISKPTMLYTLDETDRLVLSALFSTQCGSHREMAEASSVPRATVDYRLKRLKDAGILLNSVYFISAARLGMHVYRLLVSVKGLQPELGKRLHTFSLADRNVVNFVHCLGSWDYQIGAEMTEPRDVVILVERLYREFGDHLNDIRILPVLSQTNSSQFMRYHK